MKADMGILEAVRLVFEVAVVPAIAFSFKLSNRVTRLETKMELFWNNISKMAGEYLHSPDDHHGLDWFIERHDTGMLTPAELGEYKRLLDVHRLQVKTTKERACIAGFCSAALGELIDQRHKPRRRQFWWKKPEARMA